MVIVPPLIEGHPPAAWLISCPVCHYRPTCPPPSGTAAVSTPYQSPFSLEHRHAVSLPTAKIKTGYNEFFSLDAFTGHQWSGKLMCFTPRLKYSIILILYIHIHFTSLSRGPCTKYHTQCFNKLSLYNSLVHLLSTENK